MSPHLAELTSLFNLPSRFEQDLLRCLRALPAAALDSGRLNSAAWQAAVRGADSLAALRHLLGEVRCAAAGTAVELARAAAGGKSPGVWQIQPQLVTVAESACATSSPAPNC